MRQICALLSMTLLSMTLLCTACGGSQGEPPLAPQTSESSATPSDATSAGAATKDPIAAPATRRKFALVDGEAWLMSQQQADGGWSTHPHAARTDPGDIALTGLSVLSWMSQCYSNRGQAPRNRVVALGLRFLKQRQLPDGQFVNHPRPRTLDETSLRTHAVATCALVEVQAMTGSPIYRTCAERAVAFLEKALRTTRVRDTETIAWCLLTLKTIRIHNYHYETRLAAGKARSSDRRFPYDEPAFEQLASWATDDPQADHRHQAIAALAGILFDDLSVAKDRMRARAKRLAKAPFAWDPKDGNTDPLASYLTGLVLKFSMSHPWKTAVYDALNDKAHHGAPDGPQHWSPDGLADFQGGATRLTALCRMIDSTLACTYSSHQIEHYRVLTEPLAPEGK